MFTTSKYLNGGSPLVCRNCNQPFRTEDSHFRAWHGKDGKYYCQEDCEQDALEAKARRARVFS